MKVSQIWFAVVLILGVSSVASADPLDDQAIEASGLLREIASLTQSCVVEPYVVTSTGEKITGPLKSLCKELRKSSRGGVEIFMNGRKYHAFLVESEDADGGDLNHLLIVDTRGDVVAERRNVLAFNEVYIALAGGNHRFRQVRE